MSTLIITLFRKDGTIITVSELSDLENLPDKSIEVLYYNENYMEIIYLYALYRLDMYLRENLYSEKRRIEFFNSCFSIVPELVKHEKIFFDEKQFSPDGVFKKIPARIAAAHKDCVEAVCDFISGMISTTPLLDERIFNRERLRTLKHNYATIISLIHALLA